MLRKFRIASQIVFFTLFCICFYVLNTYPLAYAVPADIFLRLNPLVALLTETAARTLIPALLVPGLIIAIISMVCGRVFCGFMCPLGAVIDFSDAFLFKRARSPDHRPPLYFQRFKYIVLFALLVLAAFGVIFPLFMDPIALFTRVNTIVINPLISMLGMNSLALTGPLWGAVGLENLQLMTIKIPVFYGILFTSGLFLLVIAGSFWDRRFWCQYVCPSGAFFALLSRAPFFRRMTFSAGCNSCSGCARVCPTRAIDADKIERTRSAECVVCGLCTDVKGSCSGFGFSVPKAAALPPGPALQRRHFLFGMGGGLLLAPAFISTAVNKSDGHGRLIRPPGAVPENDFLARCIACGNCMKACPTNALQPCTFGDGFNRLYTPRLVPRIGACDAKCHLCGYACPTGALRRIPMEEKPYVKIGTAVVDRHRCLAWEQNKECLVCDEVCPFNAIEPKLVETTEGPFRVPVVHEELCMGCGLCELRCPVFDKAAIEVYRFGENRRATGLYASDFQKQKIDALREKSEGLRE